MPSNKDLLTLHEVAEVLGITYNTARYYCDNRNQKRDPTLPEPDKIVGRSFLWYRKTIVDWGNAHSRSRFHASTHRPRGRPRKDAAQGEGQ